MMCSGILTIESKREWERKGKKRSEKEARRERERGREGERVGWWYDSTKKSLNIKLNIQPKKKYWFRKSHCTFISLSD